MASRGTPFIPLLVGLAVVLGLAAAAWILLDDGPSSPDSGNGRVVSQPEGNPTPPDEASLPVYVPEEREEPPPAAPPPTGGLSGRLVDALRHPVPRGRVQALAGRKSLFLAGGAQLESLGVDPVEVSGDGRFHFDGLPVNTNITLRMDGDSFTRTEVGPFSVRSGEVKDVGDVITEKGYTIRGSVLDAQGMAVPLARVALTYGAFKMHLDGAGQPRPERVVETDDEGHFELPHAARLPFTISVSAEGFANTAVQGGTLPSDNRSELKFTIQLERASTLRGRVVSAEDDTPLADITLIATHSGVTGSQALTVSNRDGQFMFDDLAAGPHKIQADGDGWTKRTVTVAAKALDSELVIRMTKEGAIRGRVTTPDGAPVPAFDLCAFFGKTKTSVGSPTPHTLRVRDNDGRFEVPGLEPGWYRLEVWSSGYALTTTGSIRIRAGKTVDGVSITMQHGATIRGRVVDDLDRPIVGAAISLHASNLAHVEFVRQREWKAAWQLTTHTDAEGVFQLTDVSERAYQVQVDHPDYPIFLVNDVVTERGQLADIQTIVVPRPGEISGVAMNADGQLMRRGTVSLGGPISRTAQPDGEGRFRFRRLLPGEYFLDARSKDGSSTFSFALEVQRGLELQPINVQAGQTVSTTVSAP